VDQNVVTGSALSEHGVNPCATGIIQQQTGVNVNQRSKKVASLAAVCVVGVFAFTGCGSTGSSDSAVSSTATTTTTESEPTLQEVYSQNRSNTLKLCESYFSLVDQGWSNDDIYGTLSDAGTYDGYYGNSGRLAFNELTKWCYTNA